MTILKVQVFRSILQRIFFYTFMASLIIISSCTKDTVPKKDDVAVIPEDKDKKDENKKDEDKKDEDKKDEIINNIKNVSTSAQLSTAISIAKEGDIIVLANGSYSGFTVTRSNITIRAANKGGAEINSGIIRLSKVSNVSLLGLKISTPGSSQTIDGESFKVAIWFEATNDCRLAGSVLKLNGHTKRTDWVMLSGNSNNNRIDHNEFGANSIGGSYILVRGNRTGINVPNDRTDWANGNGPINPNMARHTTIDYNYFHDKSPGTSEVMTLGGIGIAGDYQDTYTLVENNLFVNCDGDAEIIANKSSSNTIRNNTIRTSIGTLSLRAGNNCVLSDNIMLQEGKAGTSGIKVYEQNHKVTGNYVDSPLDYAFVMGAGTSYTSSDFSHAQVVNATVTDNIFINLNERGVIIGHGGNNTTVPEKGVFSNNTILGSLSDSKLLNLNKPGTLSIMNNTMTGPNPPMPRSPLTTSETGAAAYTLPDL